MFIHCWKEVSALGRWKVKGSIVLLFEGATLTVHPPEEHLVRPIRIQVVDKSSLLAHGIRRIKSVVKAVLLVDNCSAHKIGESDLPKNLKLLFFHIMRQLINSPQTWV